MIAADKIGSDMTAYWIVGVLVLIVFGRYGRRAIEWILMTLYEFFVQKNPMNL